MATCYSSPCRLPQSHRSLMDTWLTNWPGQWPKPAYNSAPLSERSGWCQLLWDLPQCHPWCSAYLVLCVKAFHKVQQSKCLICAEHLWKHQPGGTWAPGSFPGGFVTSMEYKWPPEIIPPPPQFFSGQSFRFSELASNVVESGMMNCAQGGLKRQRQHVQEKEVARNLFPVS